MNIQPLHIYSNKQTSLNLNFSPQAADYAKKTKPHGLQGDYFVKKQPVQQINFNGRFKLTDLYIKFLKNKSYNTSLRGSKRPYLSLSEDLKNMVTPVQIKVSKNEEITAWDINPKNSNKYVLFLHGFSQNITSNQPLYKALSETDYGVLAIDYRGYGNNKPSNHISENDIIQDVKAAEKYLKNKGVHNIGLIGHSFGSYIAAKTSNLNPYKFQILVSPMLSLEFWLKNVLKHPKKYKNEEMLIRYVPTFKDQYARIFDISRHLTDNTTPTYVVQAKRDSYVRTSKVNNLITKIPKLNSYTIIPTGGHRMDTNKIEEISRILNNL